MNKTYCLFQNCLQIAWRNLAKNKLYSTINIKFRTFNVMDDCAKEALAIEADSLLFSNASSQL